MFESSRLRRCFCFSGFGGRNNIMIRIHRLGGQRSRSTHNIECTKKPLLLRLLLLPIPGIQYILIPGGPRSYTSKAWVPLCPLYFICELVLFSSGIRHHSLSHSNFCVTVVVGRKSAIAIPRTIFRLRHSLWLLSFIMLIDTV